MLTIIFGYYDLVFVIPTRNFKIIIISSHHQVGQPRILKSTGFVHENFAAKMSNEKTVVKILTSSHGTDRHHLPGCLEEEFSRQRRYDIEISAGSGRKSKNS